MLGISKTGAGNCTAECPGSQAVPEYGDDSLLTPLIAKICTC